MSQTSTSDTAIFTGVPYAPAQLVVSAVSSLAGSHPLAVVTIPALLRTARAQGLDPVADGVPFGSTEETQLLDEYFRLPRPPDPDRPWRAPWSSQEPWQKRRYPGGSLQRMRRDANARGRILQQQKRPGQRDVWRLRDTAGMDLMTADQPAPTPIQLIDLALWMGRNQDVLDLDGLMAWFNAEFAPGQADLLGTIYLSGVPENYRQTPFAVEPIDDDAFLQLGSLPVAPTVEGTLSDLIERLERRIRAGDYQLPTGLVRRVLSAWLRGDIVVLLGQPGTGKTMFADLLARAMEVECDLDPPLLIPIRADFDEAEFIGYERLDGTPQFREFATSVLRTESPLEARVVILEEFNLAAVETYLASVLVATQEQERLVRLPTGIQSQLPIDSFLIATCNSYRDEPETRTRVSSPAKRRSTVITMPNVLGDRFDDDPDEAVLGLVIEFVTAEARRVAARTEANRNAQFDAIRSASLESVRHLDDLSTAVRNSLVAVTSAILSTPVGRSWFTLGLLKDMVLEITYAERNETAEMVALGQAVADKLVHQIRGTHADIQELREACGLLPNAEEIMRLIDQVMNGPSDELIPLL